MYQISAYKDPIRRLQDVFFSYLLLPVSQPPFFPPSLLFCIPLSISNRWSLSGLTSSLLFSSLLFSSLLSSSLLFSSLLFSSLLFWVSRFRNTLFSWIVGNAGSSLHLHPKCHFIFKPNTSSVKCMCSVENVKFWKAPSEQQNLIYKVSGVSLQSCR